MAGKKREAGEKGTKSNNHAGEEGTTPENRRARRAAAAAAAAAAEAAAIEAQHAGAARDADDGLERSTLVGYDLLDEELWLQVLHNLDGRSLGAAACTCSAISRLAATEALWAQLHSQLFVSDGADCNPVFSAPAPPWSTGNGMSERERVCQSEAQLDRWRRVGRTPPLSLPLAGMTSVALLGAVGVSTHAGRLVRLWEARSGRRLAARIHKHELSACAGAAGIVAVGDVYGGVHVYGVEGDFLPCALTKANSQPIRSLALHALPAAQEPSAVVVASSGGAGCGRAEVAVLCTDMQRAVLPTAELAVSADDVISVAIGPEASICASSGRDIALYRLDGAFGPGANGAGRVALWSAEWDPSAAQPWALRAGAAGATQRGAEAQLAEAFGAGLALSGGSAEQQAAAGGSAPVEASGAAGSNAPAPSRLLSYSPAWRLLAAAVDGGVVALWDLRVAGDRGCAAAVRLGDGSGNRASWVHLDEGQSLSGHLLLSPASGEGLHAYDVRRVASARHPSAAVPVCTLRAAVSCFAAEGPNLIIGSGPKSAESLRYRVGSLAAEPADEDDAAPKSTKPARTKPARNAPTQCFKRTSRPQ